MDTTNVGRWTERENQRLVYYCDKQKKECSGFMVWTKIAEKVGSRTSHQCKVHYNLLSKTGRVEEMTEKVLELQRRKAFSIYLQKEMESLPPSVEIHKRFLSWSS
jgi:hypothetical protein